MTIIDLGRTPASSAPVGERVRPGALARHRRGQRRSLPLVRMVIALMVVVVVLWGGFLPQQIGGRMSYVITDGISMLPDIHAGELVILRREPTYHVGEVAAYHNKELGVVVLHRIVAIKGDRYVFKGDNNDFVTTYEPTKAQIVGAVWARWSAAGRMVLDLRVPVVAAVLLGGLWLFTFWSRSSTRRQRRRRRHAR